MRALAIAAASGLLCIPATYSLVRQGDLAIAAAVTMALAAAGGVAATATAPVASRTSVMALAAAFCIGALAGQIVSFGRYYVAYGCQDPKLRVGVTVGILEVAAIAIVGGCVISFAGLLARHATKR